MRLAFGSSAAIRMRFNPKLQEAFKGSKMTVAELVALYDKHAPTLKASSGKKAKAM